MVPAATHVENNMGLRVEVTFCRCFHDTLYLSLQITNGFYGIRY